MIRRSPMTFRQEAGGGYTIGHLYPSGEFASVEGKATTEKAARLFAACEEMVVALRALLDCPALNMDDLEPADQEAYRLGEAAMRKAVGQ